MIRYFVSSRLCVSARGCWPASWPAPLWGAQAEGGRVVPLLCDRAWPRNERSAGLLFFPALRVAAGHPSGPGLTEAARSAGPGAARFFRGRGGAGARGKPGRTKSRRGGG